MFLMTTITIGLYILRYLFNFSDVCWTPTINPELWDILEGVIHKWQDISYFCHQWLLINFKLLGMECQTFPNHVPFTLPVPVLTSLPQPSHMAHTPTAVSYSQFPRVHVLPHLCASTGAFPLFIPFLAITQPSPVHPPGPAMTPLPPESLSWHRPRLG